MIAKKPFNNNELIESSLKYLSAYGMYYLGALIDAETILREPLINSTKKADKAYRAALISLITKDKRSMQMYLDGVNEICFKNHKKDKKGNVVECEAYFVENN